VQERRQAGLLAAALDQQLRKLPGAADMALPATPALTANAPPAAVQSAAAQVQQDFASWDPWAAHCQDSAIWAKVEAELTRQVRHHCSQRGNLLKRVLHWRNSQFEGSIVMVQGLRERLCEACTCIKEMSTALENSMVQLDSLKGQLKEATKNVDDTQQLQSALAKCEARMRGYAYS
jgi:hypothetical protein